MVSLGERLEALSGEVGEEKKPEKGAWLRQKMEEFKLRQGITEDTKPTMDLIKLQVCLPQIKTEQDEKDYKELLKWENVTGEKVPLPPSWARSNLPEEEEEIKVLSPPPQVDRQELGTGKWILPGPTIKKEEILNNNVDVKIPRKEEVLNNNDLDDSVEVTVFDSSCVIR